MSTKPHPIALTAAMLAVRGCEIRPPIPGLGLALLIRSDAASLASDLHRIAKACHKLAEAECNGEWREGQRRICEDSGTVAYLDEDIAKYASRLDRRLAKLNDSLAPFALACERRDDPNGFTMVLVSTDPSRPVPSNGMESGVWGVQ